MKWRSALLFWTLLAALDVQAETVHPTLSNGVVSYVGEGGQRREIQVGKKCADLWVAPDESIIAFIAIDKAQPANANNGEPFIEESSIYFARKSDQFRPVHIVLKKLLIAGRVWTVVRQPSVSPDLKTVYFSVPFTMTSWKLLSTSLTTHAYTIVGNADSYCVVWGGEYSGELLMQVRREENTGVKYPCFVRSKSGTVAKVADEDKCWGFGEFAISWSREHGGSCRQPDVETGN